jgi:hypothetical protein
MENPGISLENIGKKFATPQEELEFLRGGGGKTRTGNIKGRP